MGEASSGRGRSVCLVTHSGYPVEPRCRRMAEALARQGYAVDVLALRLPGQAEREVMNGVQVYRLPVRHHQGAGALVYLAEYATFFAGAALHLLRLDRMQHYHLVQVHNPPDALLFSALPLKSRGVPLVLDLRELTPELFMSRFGLARRSAVVRLLTAQERLACACADAVLVLHERHRRIMLARGIPGHKLTQVMNCPDERLFDPARTPATRVPDNTFVVIYHGGMMYRYGVDLLVQAAAQVRAHIPGLRLELYGTGDYLPAVERLVRELGLADIVRFHGQQPLELMPQAIAAADVGVVPMRQDVFTDCGLPTKLLEYVALGVPAIASRTATTADYFDDSMVQFFRPGDASDLAEKLLTLYHAPELRREQAERARRFTAQYNWATERARYLELLARLMARGSSPAAKEGS